MVSGVVHHHDIKRFTPCCLALINLSASTKYFVLRLLGADLVEPWHGMFRRQSRIKFPPKKYAT